MAIVSEPISSSLKLMVQTGVDDGGNPVIRARSFSRVKPTAEDEAVYTAATTLGELQEHALMGVRRVAEVDLVEE